MLKGCSCKGGCSTNRCGCRKKGIPCGVGCGCTGCVNKEDQHETINNMPVDSNTDSSTDESDTEQENDNLDTYVNKIMNEVFGQWEAPTDNHSSEEEYD